MCNSFSGEEYIRRIHKVQDYIEENLNNTMALSELSDIAGFSRYHFHRIFQAMTKETLLQYVSRIKMERAAFNLIHRPEITVTDIAYHFGFSDSAVFSRAFKNYYGLSPTAYKKQHRKNCKDPAESSQYYESTINHSIGGSKMEVKANSVETVSVDMQVIYVRFTGSYQQLAAAMPGMMERLYGFAVSQNLLEYGKTKTLTVYHDNPESTDEAQRRTSLCMTIPDNAKIPEQGDIGSMRISGKFAVGHFEVYQNEYTEAWAYMYGDWLPNSGNQPRDAFPFEVYVSDPSQNPGGKQLVDIYLPVEPLGKI